LGAQNRQEVHIWQSQAGISKPIGSDYTFLALPEQKKLDSIAAREKIRTHPIAQCKTRITLNYLRLD